VCVCVCVYSCIKEGTCQQPSCNYGTFDIRVRFCPCAALDDVCINHQMDNIDDDSDDNGSGDEHFLDHYYNYYDNYYANY